MKLTPDLTRAIKAVISRRNTDAQLESANRTKKVADWINRTPRVKRLYNQLEIVRKKEKVLENQIAALGLKTYVRDVNDIERLAKAGLKLDNNAPLREETVMAQLACATPEEGMKIVKSIGINWDEPASRKS
jgi:hypothetical protein